MTETSTGSGTSRARGLLGGLSSLVGYAGSMVLLAVASLVVIPELILSDGARAWGSIAFGQALGAIGAVVVAYGWQLSGPSLVAQGDDASRRREIEEAVVLKLWLFVPTAGVAAGAAALFSHVRPDLAAIGAVSAVSIGLTASWYFVGLSQPYRLLLAETVPRVLGTVVGIVLMRLELAGAFTALVCQLGGMLLGAALSVGVILRSLPPRPPGMERRPARTTLRRQVHGLGASVTSTAYVSAPLVIVSLVAPGIQPVYALVDKLSRQIAVGLTPVVSLLQGWVPRAAPGGLEARVRRALALTTAASAVLACVVAALGPFLVGYVGGGLIEVDVLVYVLMGLLVGSSLLETAVAHAMLPPLGRLDVVARATALSAVIGLPLTVVGALFSVGWAMAGLLVGLLSRLLVESRFALRPPAGSTAGHTT